MTSDYSACVQNLELTDQLINYKILSIAAGLPVQWDFHGMPKQVKMQKLTPPCLAIKTLQEVKSP